MEKQKHSFCYVWDWEAKVVNGYEKEDYLEELNNIHN